MTCFLLSGAKFIGSYWHQCKTFKNNSFPSQMTYRINCPITTPSPSPLDRVVASLVPRPPELLWRRSNKHLPLCCNAAAPSQAPVTPPLARKFIGPLLDVSEQSVSIKLAIMLATPSQQRFTSLTDTSCFKVLSVASPRAGGADRREERRLQTAYYHQFDTVDS